jgi:crotonobetainyl-CoA:carnitine CoA-transferase CaiB-like acyl-CoA transferase
VWVSITGYGTSRPERDRVAFGDDAAVAGGLVAWCSGQPVFCADAIADALTAFVAARAVVDALARGGRWLLDVSMASVAQAFAGPTVAVPNGGVDVAAPRARDASGRGPALGEHTASVLARLDIAG